MKKNCCECGGDIYGGTATMCDGCASAVMWVPREVAKKEPAPPVWRLMFVGGMTAFFIGFGSIVFATEEGQVYWLIAVAAAGLIAGMIGNAKTKGR